MRKVVEELFDEQIDLQAMEINEIPKVEEESSKETNSTVEDSLDMELKEQKRETKLNSSCGQNTIEYFGHNFLVPTRNEVIHNPWEMS